MTTVNWTGQREMRNAIQRYGDGCYNVAADIMEYYAPQIEADAQETAPWTDRTGDARAGLFTEVFFEETRIILVLAHLMEYGVYLETKYAGRYAIIWPTIQGYALEIFGAIIDSVES